jgi:hypothetical protein
MGFFSPRRSSLYSKALVAVTLFGCLFGAHNWIAAQGVITQYGKKAVSKGPRALGLIAVTPSGKARITPVAIMVDGKFFDAGSYKGMPVPMALDFGVVYEGFLAGATQGLFTITQPGQLNHNWMAEGTWLPAGAKPPETSKKYEPPKIEDNDAPPVLHRKGEKAEEKPAGSSPAPTTSPTSSPSSAPSAPPATESKSSAPPAAKASSDSASIDDPNRPILRRGKPDPSARHEAMKTFSEDEFAVPKASKAATVGKKDKAAEIRVIPAISDAGGPDARPYTFDSTPKEEASYREKMLDLAAVQLGWQTPPASGSASARKITAAKPVFENVQLRIFDLSNSNQPVLVLSARTPVTSSEDSKEITLIARTNLEDELRKLFFSKTDAHHLDETPRMELIDAVDADGDGRGELLFRRTFDSGSVYAIYRVTADQIWPLYEPGP